MTITGTAPRFSIVLCTRNPRQAYLAEVLAAIANQTVGVGDREVIVVDSCSQPPLTHRSITWPARTTIVRIDQPGVARARVAGIRAAARDWIVFVDDDNVLDADYLEQAAAIIKRRPDLALFCGRISGVFETPPPSWLSRFYRQLAIIDFPEDSWASRWEPGKVPCWTAGMCIRRDVAANHCHNIENDEFAMALQRCEDVQLIMNVLARGFSAGLFRSLHMRHLIAADRTTPRYLCRISYETGYNMSLLSGHSARPTYRDVLRPIRNAARATVLYGWSPHGQIERAAAAGAFLGTVHRLWKASCSGNRS